MVEEKEIIEKLLNGKLKLHQIDKLVGNTEKSVDIRRKFIQTVSNTTLEHISKYSLSMEEAIKRNIENPIGTIQIPLGIAGPLEVHGEYANGDYYIPLATTEGALIASINRGFSVIKAAGGTSARIIEDKMTRAPVIKAESVVEAIKIRDWIKLHFNDLKEAAESTSRHGKLVKIDPIIIVGKYVYPRFVYKTGDSMGMNMVTIATDTALDLLAKK
ncbi:MAG: 3-hydroxy-3-methylglutaryl-CoA reductase, partial [Methanobacterium sp.]|nr:3-hydroxy-3-methylglutaryl-CoA reductase [Methanobacterium sp.]